MSRSSFLVDDTLQAYVRAHSEPVDPIAAALIEETATTDRAGMQISPEQGLFLSMVVRIMGARRILEIGTFTGYSALCMARALGGDGVLVACDINEDWTAMARRYWRQAGVEDRIDLRIGPALDTLSDLGNDDPFDLCFIDADKPAYPAYLEAVVPLLRPGGLLLADNVLMAGRIRESTSESAAGLRRFNGMAVADPRIDTLLLAAFDGLTMAVKT